MMASRSPKTHFFILSASVTFLLNKSRTYLNEIQKPHNTNTFPVPTKRQRGLSRLLVYKPVVYCIWRNISVPRIIRVGSNGIRTSFKLFTAVRRFLN